MDASAALAGLAVTAATACALIWCMDKAIDYSKRKEISGEKILRGRDDARPR